MHMVESGENGFELKSDFKAKQTSQKQQDETKKLILNHKSDDPYLDLSNRNLIVPPPDLFILVHIQHLYLEGNSLVELPDNFFDRLPALLWLDLRNNQLKSLPISIGRHQCIKNLLLEDNQLTHLPLQLGMTKTLNGLSLQGNPLQHPPQHIIDQGVYVILSFLYQELQNRSRQSNDKAVTNVEKLKISDDVSNSSEEEEVEILTQDINLTERKPTSPLSDDFQLLRNGLTPMPASLHKSPAFHNYKGRFGSSKMPESLVGGKLKSNNDLSLLHLRHQAEARREQLRAMKERQNTVADHRRKSNTAHQMRRSDIEKLGIVPENRSSILTVDPSPVEICTNVREEKVERVLPQRKVRSSKPGSRRRRPKPARLSKASKLYSSLDGKSSRGKYRRTFEIRGDAYLFESNTSSVPNSVAKNKDALERRIRQHSREIHNRMRQSRSSDDQQPPTSKEYQRQLLEEKMNKQMELDYRFKAFTGDSLSTKSDSQKTTST